MKCPRRFGLTTHLCKVAVAREDDNVHFFVANPHQCEQVKIYIVQLADDPFVEQGDTLLRTNGTGITVTTWTNDIDPGSLLLIDDVDLHFNAIPEHPGEIILGSH